MLSNPRPQVGERIVDLCGQFSPREGMFRAASARREIPVERDRSGHLALLVAERGRNNRDFRVRELFFLLPVEPGRERLGASLTAIVDPVVAVRRPAQYRYMCATPPSIGSCAVSRTVATAAEHAGGACAGYVIDQVVPLKRGASVRFRPVAPILASSSGESLPSKAELVISWEEAEAGPCKKCGYEEP